MAHSTTIGLNPIEIQVLLLIARIGRLLSRHLGTAWGHPFTVTIQTVNRTLAKLVDAKLLTYCEHFQSHGYDPRGALSWTRHGRLYSLTPLGWEIVKQAFPTLEEGSERLAPTMFNPQHQAEHQIEYAEVITSLIQSLSYVPGIVGMSSYIEMDLGPTARPRADGIVVVRRWADATLPDCERSSMYPWLGLGQQPGQIDQLSAIEIDRGTEELSIITGKANSYRELYRSRYWEGRYSWPLIAFTVPTERRKRAVLDAWEIGWPGSQLLIATIDDVRESGVLAPIWTTQYTKQGQRIQQPHRFLRAAWFENIIA
ncbi:replication-relaxation family protein [Herpetosiphon giganteus]|uniref:replication-relaxation family protein n=1 Tax=Herpetosiphon giganteus TaxID=2029754 RepID=UPI0019574804|nr:replication-relaxation family protein [Herpetosiphon giganteus]MBM7843786.1 DNA-binding MarR family transcriptional regulator [Herpetosiphon giganteus]